MNRSIQVITSRYTKLFNIILLPLTFIMVCLTTLHGLAERMSIPVLGLSLFCPVAQDLQVIRQHSCAIALQPLSLYPHYQTDTVVNPPKATEKHERFPTLALPESPHPSIIHQLSS